MESAPSLPHLMFFPSYPDRVEQDIIESIGRKYHNFGIILLNDDNGSIIDSIEMKFRDDPYRITQEILKRWLQGRGREPVTYATLVKVLKMIGLKVLAQTIESSLR